MKLFLFSLLLIVFSAMLLGCADDKLNVVLDQLDRPTYEVVDDAALCYNHFESDLISYYIALDRLCVDLLVTGKTLEELTLDTTVSAIIADTDTYHGEYVELEAFVIFKNDEGIVIADVNNDLTNDVLTVIEYSTEYIDSLTQGNKYTFMIQVWITENVNGGRLVAEPTALDNM